MFGKILAFTTKMIVGVSFLGVLVAGTLFLHLRAGETRAAAIIEPRPVPVASLTLAMQHTYLINDRFIGRLEPARQASLAFERGGLVTSVLFDEGALVEKNALVATLDDSLLKAEKSKLLAQGDQIKARLELARLTQSRQKKLQLKGHASLQKFDAARLNVKAIEGEFAALKASINRLDIDIEKLKILAPFPGTIATRFIDPGTVVNAGTALVELLETTRPQARLGLSPITAAALEIGETVTLISGGHKFDGIVKSIRPDIQSATRTVSTLVDLPANTLSRLALHFGDIVELHITREIQTTGYWIPVSSLTEGERGLWSVLTLSKNNDGRWVTGLEAIEIIHMQDESVFVRGTLRDGQMIIPTGRNRVIAGQVVTLANTGEQPS